MVKHRARKINKPVTKTVKGSLVEIEMYIEKFKLAKKRHHWLIQIIKI